jgi:rod shape-determining protein MreB and related proteins
VILSPLAPTLEVLRRCTVAVDLGAARTRVYLRGSGLVVDEPSVAALDVRTGALIAVGARAETMAGRTPEHIRVARPVSGGVVVDVDMAQRMLRYVLGDKLGRRRLKLMLRGMPVLRAALCMPHGSEPIARRAATETLFGLGARRVELVDTLLAAAVGCGLPVEQPEATMIVVCGAGTTHVAVLSLGAIVAARTVAVGGEAIDRAVVEYLRNQHALVLPSQAVRPLQQRLGPPGQGGAAATTEVHGRDVVSGLARSVVVGTEGVREAMHAPLTAVLDAITEVLRESPPDLVADLADRGIMLAGGSAHMPGLDLMLRQAMGIPVHTAPHPDTVAVRGLGAMIEGKVRATPLDPLAAV